MLKWDESGVGAPIICLHGFGGSSRDYTDLTEYLRPHGRVYALHLSVLFSSHDPVTFSQMVESVTETIQEIVKDGQSFHLIGTSFGGTLSWAVRTKFPKQILSHTLINPMPLDPVQKLKHPFLRGLIRYGQIPGLMKFLIRTEWGRYSLVELGKNFRIAFHKHQEHRRFHQRKLDLITYALARFFWVSSKENWKKWQVKSETVPMNLLITGHKDSLYSLESFCEYKNYCQAFHHILPSGEHVATRTHAEEIAYLFLKHNAVSDENNKKISNF